jgi:methylthioribose-1-phosphate isomerase
VPQWVRSARSPRLEWVRSAKSTTFEGTVTSPIKQVATMTGRAADGRIETVRIVAEGSPVANYRFDVTPARLVSGLITERGVRQANRDPLAGAFAERVKSG